MGHERTVPAQLTRRTRSGGMAAVPGCRDAFGREVGEDTLAGLGRVLDDVLPAASATPSGGLDGGSGRSSSSLPRDRGARRGGSADAGAAPKMPTPEVQVRLPVGGAQPRQSASVAAAGSAT